MKKTLILALVAVLLACGPALAAKGPQNVTYTPHNLSSSAPDFMLASDWDSEDQICIFCHTPHGGSLDGPLWNRSLASTTYQHYNSATLSTAAKTRGQNIYPESAMCLSCHDGSLSMYDVLNHSNDLGADPFSTWNPTGEMMGGANSPVIGESQANPGVATDLTDDHPISFSYSAVYTEYVGKGKASQLNDTTVARGKGVEFFGADFRLECSSCHDPHVNYYDSFLPGDTDFDTSYAPFLRTTNNGSGLCLACHNK